MIKKIIENNYLSLMETREKKHFYVTDATKCNRQVYYSFNEKPTQVPSSESVMRMEYGKMAEDVINRILEKAGCLISTQTRVDVPIANGYDLHGQVDQIVEVDGKKYICECKTFYGYYQEKNIKEGELNEGYICQLGQYIYHLRDQVEPIGYLFMMSRDSLLNYEFAVEVKDKDIYCNDKLINNIDNLNQKFKALSEKLQKKQLPDCEYSYKYDDAKLQKDFKSWTTRKQNSEMKKIQDAVSSGESIPTYGDWQCKYCDFKELCLKEQGVELGYSSDDLKGIYNIFAISK